MLRDIQVAQPDAGNEVGSDRFESVEVVVQRQQDERVLLDVVPPPPRLATKQPGDNLGNQVGLRRLGDQGIQDDAVGAVVRVQDQVGILAVVGGERRGTGSIRDPVVEEALNLGLGRRVIEHRPQPGDGIET